MSNLYKIESFQERIDNFLKRQLDNIPPNDPRLLEAMRYGLLIGGKRMRPYLAYITAECIDVDLNDVDAIAAALECIHAYSLIHDDLPAMDDDNLRRGKATCHIAFDEATAILAGDALQTLAFEILANHEFTDFAKTKQIHLIRHLSKAAGYRGMCGGQAMDIDATNKSIELTQLEQVHRLKTGALLSAAVAMVTECSNALTQTHKASLRQFSENIGLAYQVRDDIIDITSSEQELGKPKGSDLEANKSTYPSLLGLQGAQDKLLQLEQLALQALATLPYNTTNLSDFADFIVNRTK